MSAALAVTLFLVSMPVCWAEQEKTEKPPVRRDPAVGNRDQAVRTADWLDVAFSTRFRYETVDNRFKLGEAGSDQQIPHRDRIGIGIKKVIDPLRFLFEFENSQAFLTDAGSTVNQSMVNHHDILQLYAGVVLNQEPGSKYPSALYFGRQSFDLGSRRLFARNRYRNTTNRWDGFRWSLGDAKGRTLDTFVFQPVRIRSYDMDRRVKRAWFWGSFFSTRLERGAGLELYYFHLHEDPHLSSSLKRHHATFGGRLLKNGTPGAFGYEIELALQVGKAAELDHLAHMVHWQLGYTFQAPWQPSITGMWDYASGDSDPADHKSGTFDTLFGARRWDYGPTGILNWMYRSNINSPDIHLGFKPARKLEFLPSMRWLWLAGARAPWVGTGLHDTSGRSGTYVGRLVELRFRCNLAPYFRPEFGYARFYKGSYARNVPGSPTAHDSNYFFIDLELVLNDLIK